MTTTAEVSLDADVCVPTSLDSRRDEREPMSAWVNRAACAGRTSLFDDATRSDEAVAVCARCPVLRQCHTWALLNAVDGVAGGMTAKARTAWRTANGIREPRVSLDDFLPIEVVGIDFRKRLGRSDAVLGAVARWTENGESGRQIADRLRVTRRTVNRLRASCRQRAISA